MNNKSKIFLKAIRYLATTIVILMVAAQVYLFIVRPGDDIAGGVFMSRLGIAFFGLIAIVIKKFE